ncbi:hypothetical protein SDC9_78672 [bioreactor metagenome]|uniref:Uncharacterized protein n=1 Tax=bioreactor metagenome TaxID=1076179 RepID=A0A644Z046_9ZZZZ
MLNENGILIFHLRQLRIICGAEAHDIKVRVAAFKVNHQFVVRGEGDHVVWHPAYNVAEQPCVQHQSARLGHIGGQNGADSGLHVIAGDRDGLLRAQQETLQSGDGAFLRHGAGSHAHGVLQECFFTGEFHRPFSFLSELFFLIEDRVGTENPHTTRLLEKKNRFF